MKQFELKFYKEWYDALSELSTEDRAAAAIALLEYVYDDKLPEDQFIRIVTTLMRNKIDREKAIHDRRNNHSASFSSVSESTGSLLTSSPTQDSSEASSIVEPLDESLPSHPKSTQVLLSDEEAAAASITDPQPINKILRTHYNLQNKALSEFAQKHNVNPRLIAEAAKEIIIRTHNSSPSTPVPDASNFKRDKLDALALAKIKIL
ncbi:MAG: hypothetical protein HDR88_04230 [Bacteroides sp.]|nr:hypothetical protein [Bacteroides sp.]